MSSMFEDLKDLLSEIENFLSVALKTASLPKHVTNEKEELLKRIKSLKDDYPQLQPGGKVSKSSESTNAETAVRPGSEIYDDIEPHQVSGSGSGSYGTSNKPPSLSGSEASVSQVVVPQQPASISVSDVTEGASQMGFLVKKLHGKAKMDIKSMASKLMLTVAGKRYCVANGGVLYLFDKQTSKKQSESIILKDYEVRVSSEPPTKKEFYFDMIGPGLKSYTFAASTTEEMDQWISALNDESTKTPNLRVSVMGDADADEEEYEDAEDVVPRAPPAGLANKKIPVPPSAVKPAAAPAVRPPAMSKGARAPSFLDDDGELYDDIVTSDDHHDNDDGQEVYDDAQSKGVGDDDDLVYECYDDIKEELQKNAKTTSRNPASPPLPPAKLSTANAGPPVVSNSAILSSNVKAIRREIPAKPVPVVEPMVSPSVEDYPNMYYGKWDCEAEDANEIAFKYGDIITVLSREYEKFGWWVGQLNGTIGLVPCGYLSPAYELVTG